MLSNAWTFVRSLFQSKIYEVRHCCSPDKRVFVRRIGLLTYILDPSFTALWERHLTPAQVLAHTQPREYKLGDQRHMGFIAQDIGIIAPVFETPSDKPEMVTIPMERFEAVVEAAFPQLTVEQRRQAEAEGRLVPANCTESPMVQLGMHIQERNRRYHELPMHLRPDPLWM